MDEKEFQAIFPMGGKNEAFAAYFFGQSYLNMLTTSGVNIGNVTFKSECHNNWHIHHRGHIQRAKGNGIIKEKMVEVLTQLAFYAG